MKFKQLALNATVSFAAIALCSPVTVFAQSATTNSTGTQAVVIDNIEPEEGWWGGLPKEDKMLYTTGASAIAIGIWGLAQWDYGSADFHSSDEGWFGADSKYGGADKVGHFWATYAFSDALTALYKSWGYAPVKANNYGALSAWIVQAAMELGDATSETQGFSWEDMAANTVGALTSVLMQRYPELDRKIDFRVEYVFENEVNGIFDDYSNQYYSMALKFDGFDTFEDSFMRYVELHGGYYSRGYGEEDEENVRGVYAGITLNFSRILYEQEWNKTGKVLEYIQIPYSVLKVKNEL